jgi:hypothetical protein
MNNDSELFENFLREFKPRPPGAFRRAAQEGWEWRRLAAAAIVALAVAGAGWVLARKVEKSNGEIAWTTVRSNSQEKSGGDLSLLRLTHLALNNPAALDRELVTQSRAILPRFTEGNGALRALAKE